MTENDNAKKLADLINTQKTEYDVLAEAVKEIVRENGLKRKAQAKDLLRQALEIKSKIDLLNNEKKRLDKELGKVMNGLKNIANGNSINFEEEDQTPTQ